MLYTVTASLPLFYMILKFILHINSRLINLRLSLGRNLAHAHQIVALALVLGFLVKLPMFLTHMWLPKAHVEAPVAGSMFLAAVLLKLGGAGLIRFGATLGASFMPVTLFRVSGAALL